MRNEDRGRDRETTFAFTGPQGFKVWHYLIGINLGHSRSYLPIVIEDEKEMMLHRGYPEAKLDSGRLLAEQNNGMMRIAPAWKIREMLQYQEFIAMAKARKKLEKKKEKASHALDSTSENTRGSVNLGSKEEFESALRKVAQKKRDK